MTAIGFVVVLNVAPFVTGNEARRFDGRLLSALKAALAEAAWPGLTVPQAAANLKTAENAVGFVRDGVATVEYHGSYHDGAATLRTRVANDVDKARLLAELLQQLGYTTQVVSTTPGEGFRVHTPVGLERPRPAIAALKALISRFDVPSGPESTTRPSVLKSERAAYAAVDREVDTTLEFLKRELSRRNWRANVTGDADVAVAETWALVRARKPGEPWRVFDSYGERQTLPTQVERVQWKPVQATVIVESLTKTGQAEPLITWDGNYEDLAGFDVYLDWYPRDVRLLSGADLILPLDITIKQWRPALRLGTQRIVGTAITPKSLAQVRLRVELNDNSPDARPKRRFVRTLQEFGSGFDKHEFFANHRLSLGVAGVPASVVEWRVLDELHDLQLVHQWVEGKGAGGSFSMSRGVSTRTARIVNKLVATAHRLDGKGGQLVWNGPSVVMETTRLGMLGGDVVSTTMLDQLNAPYVPAASASVDFKLKFGIATCAAEAQLVGGKSVNQRLLDGEGALQRIDPQTIVGLEPPARGSLAFSRSTKPQAAWIILPDGSLKGVVAERPLLVAKGGQSNPRRVAYAGGALVALGGAALVAGNGAAIGPVVGGVAGYLFALRRVYGSITQRVEEIGVLIELGSVQARGSLAHRDIVSELLDGFGQGYGIGYGISVAGAGIAGYIGAGPGGASAIAGGLGIGSQAMLISEREIERVVTDQSQR